MAQNCCLITNCLSWSWLEHTRAVLVRKSLERPPALQYNLPPRWSLIKKVLGDVRRWYQCGSLTSTSLSLEYQHHHQPPHHTTRAALLQPLLDLMCGEAREEEKWYQNTNSILISSSLQSLSDQGRTPNIHILPTTFQQTSDPTLSSLLCWARLSSIQILLGRNVQNILFIKA